MVCLRVVARVGIDLNLVYFKQVLKKGAYAPFFIGITKVVALCFIDQSIRRVNVSKHPKAVVKSY